MNPEEDTHSAERNGRAVVGFEGRVVGMVDQADQRSEADGQHAPGQRHGPGYGEADHNNSSDGSPACTSIDPARMKPSFS